MGEGVWHQELVGYYVMANQSSWPRGMTIRFRSRQGQGQGQRQRQGQDWGRG